MDRMLYVAMTGAGQLLKAQSLHSHNLANAATTGFRQDLAALRAQPVFGEGLPSRVYAMSERPGVDFSPGPLASTGRELDLAIDGEGWLAVQAADGSEAYTRAGDLQLTPEGLLVTGAGHPVLGEGGPIAVPPAEKLEIGADGTLSILPLGEPGGVLVEVDRLRLVRPDPERLYKGLDGLLRLDAELPRPPADASVRLRSGMLEGSNVNAVAALVDMIDLSRQFEMQMRMMHTASQNDERSDRLLRLE